ncbi:MAG TPA: alkaline phosphatase family protein [Chthoniobacterales bacterium]|nr:alkaline phosphatase family protein [Chthoniobacterales bacterium]
MSPRAPSRKVLLIGWDSADWQVIQPLLDRGEMPVLERLINRGVMGSLTSIRPMLSPMLWNSIATGKRPFKHGVHGFTEVDRELNQVVPVSSATRQCAAIWDILAREGYRTQVTGWFATHPASSLPGICVSDQFTSPAPDPGAPWPLPNDTISPSRLTKTLTELRVRPEEIPGDVLQLFVPAAATVKQRHDKRLHQLAIHLAECFSIHAAATWLLEREPWDFAAVYYRALDWIGHHFMSFHPPMMEGIYSGDFELYREVMNGAYRLHDLLLGRLLQLAGDDVTFVLVSDHGFQSGAQRPLRIAQVPAAIAAWHRPNGIVVLQGEGLRRDELVHSASLLDITPTILALYNLPVGEDVDGRVLREVFLKAPPEDRRASWDSLGESAAPLAKSQRVQQDQAELIRQFVALGYIDDPGDDPEEAVRSTDRENHWNLAQSYLDARHFVEALPLLEEVYRAWPERWDYCFDLALCQVNLGLLEEAEQTIAIQVQNKRSAGAKLLAANIALRRGDLESCLRNLAAAETAESKLPGLQNHIGTARLRLRQTAHAESAFRKGIALNPDDAQAQTGLAQCLLRERRYEEAADAAFAAIGLRYHSAAAHHFLGAALSRLGEPERAIQAFENALRFQPSWTPAHRYLAVLRRRLGDNERAQWHREQLRFARERRTRAADFQKMLRREVAARARTRAEKLRRSRSQSSALSRPYERVSTLEAQEFLLVSGLPRSGTSLMMQILEAAGPTIMRDEERPPDENNPRGYFEWQEIRQLPKNPYLIEQAAGRVTKVISMLLPSLPRKHRFRIIFMHRDIAGVAASQAKMRERLSPNDNATDLSDRLSEHRSRILDLLRTSPNVDLLEVDYDALVARPEQSLERIIAFTRLPAAALPAMRAAIDPSLRHFVSQIDPATSAH